METNDFVPQLKVRTNLRGGQGGGYVNGVYYPDQSGVCGGTVPPTTPPTSGGGYVKGVYYPDRAAFAVYSSPNPQHLAVDTLTASIILIKAELLNRISGYYQSSPLTIQSI
jgi:hypothetical protein